MVSPKTPDCKPPLSKGNGFPSCSRANGGWSTQWKRSFVGTRGEQNKQDVLQGKKLTKRTG